MQCSGLVVTPGIRNLGGTTCPTCLARKREAAHKMLAFCKPTLEILEQRYQIYYTMVDAINDPVRKTWIESVVGYKPDRETWKRLQDTLKADLVEAVKLFTHVKLVVVRAFGALEILGATDEEILQYQSPLLLQLWRVPKSIWWDWSEDKIWRASVAEWERTRTSNPLVTTKVVPECPQ